LLINFALEYAIKRVQVNQDGLKLNGTHQLLAYADDVNILGGSVHIVKENAEALVVNNNIYLLQMGCRPVGVVTYLATNSRDGRAT
jgi:hypothetical protein